VPMQVVSSAVNSQLLRTRNAATYETASDQHEGPHDGNVSSNFFELRKERKHPTFAGRQMTCMSAMSDEIEDRVRMPMSSTRPTSGAERV
jgi:hypothetical protein